MIEFHVHLGFEPNYAGLAVWIQRQQGNMISYAKPVELQFEDAMVGDYIEPTLRLGAAESDAFLKAFAEALDKRGVKTENDAKLQGTIDATKYHLEDLRTLLKLRKA